jgi:hypothetical protein
MKEIKEQKGEFKCPILLGPMEVLWITRKATSHIL